MPDAAVPVIKNAGRLGLLDVDFPIPVKLLATLALCWIVFGPALIFVATQRGRMVKGITVYVLGAMLATATLMTIEWRWSNSESFVGRFGELWPYGSQLLGLGFGLGLVAALLGYVSRRRRAKEQASH